MRIVTWNVNGLRAIHRKGNWDWFLKHKPDVFCIQETKSEYSQLPPEVAEVPGYFSYFNWPKERKGYSGVAIYTKTKPDLVKTEFSTPILNTEGRTIEAHFGDTILFNVYFPNGGGAPTRLEYKLAFYDAFLEYIESLRKKDKKKIIVTGDFNVAHEAIDLARPKENETHVGFLPEERAWLDELLRAGYVDVWRAKNPNKVEYTYWDMKSRARDRNVGWRIDYFVVSQDLLKKVKSIKILGDVFGSDHCPLELDIDI